MPLLGALRLRGGKSKKSTSETTTTTTSSSSSSTPTTPTTPPAMDKKLPSPPLRPLRPYSVASSTSLNMFRKKEKSDLDSVEGWQPDLDFPSEMERNSQYALNSQSMSA